MHIPPELIIHQTRHWTLNQRIDSALPGYCMLGSRQPATAFHQLPEQALAEFGPLLARVEREMDALLRPRRIYVGRYGHMPGLPVHFHLIPLYDWVEELFWEDTRYRTLQQFGVPTAEPLTDGAELTLFVWREFCERADPPAVRGMDRQQAIAGLRRAFGHGVQPRTVVRWQFWRGFGKSMTR
ncbi:HIT family protein [Pseudomonas aeruginosa]|uniref:HIT family protein n=1 Tax=Pseudomonas aeruginosa TaxID=287 RepID=UPI00071B5079|nr:HIT family protein [Pseudomonas aeruginosa]KSO00059.1 HIT family protein [Pseudomonas aeruginosa]